MSPTKHTTPNHKRLTQRGKMMLKGWRFTNHSVNRDFLIPNNQCEIRQRFIFVEFGEPLLNCASIKFCVEFAFLFPEVQPGRKLGGHRGIWRRGDFYVYFHACLRLQLGW